MAGKKQTRGKGHAVKKLLENKWMDLACRIILGTVFIYASIYKIHDPCDFAKAINGYKILPGALINIQAVLLPWMEMICAIVIIQGKSARGAAVLIIGMLMMFICALSFNLIRGIEFDCGCFAAERDICDTITAWFVPEGGPSFSRMRAACDIARDILILIPALFILFFNHEKRLVFWKRATGASQ
jgi:uncharacterized membrane protein YphA (DoxX/SURF4 family)